MVKGGRVSCRMCDVQHGVRQAAALRVIELLLLYLFVRQSGITHTSTPMTIPALSRTLPHCVCATLPQAPPPPMHWPHLFSLALSKSSNAALTVSNSRKRWSRVREGPSSWRVGGRGVRGGAGG